MLKKLLIQKSVTTQRNLRKRRVEEERKELRKKKRVSKKSYKKSCKEGSSEEISWTFKFLIANLNCPLD